MGNRCGNHTGKKRKKKRNSRGAGLRLRTSPNSQTLNLRMLSCVCVLLLAASALSHLDEDFLDAQWDEWKITHLREYNGLGEEGIRRAVWDKNMRMIAAHNEEAALGLHSYEMGMNHLGDMTSEEVADKMTGLLVPLERERSFTMALDDRAVQTPQIC
ncbi:unnamed protein product [Pleuronectes platessa]|uniref:Cystein proteinase inhibitor protein salarin n=1 Tax=Pleuronectes platessa TaxID=8262 RepID=A0A9N7TV43_PLEPL|nr:unnamed protein product [Pleuronectes platessa]